jgi:ribose-phosphate pyrophosphokinase
MATAHHSVRIVAGNSHAALAEDLGDQLNFPLVDAEVTSFADGEARVHIAEDLRDSSVFIVQPTCPPVNEHLMILALLTDAARAAGAARVIAIVPYFGYARQEQRAKIGDPRSAQVVARLLGAVGVDHLVTLDLHAPALESALPMPTTILRAEDVFLPRLKSWTIPNLMIVSPDAGGMKRAQRYATELHVPLAAVVKQRAGPDEVRNLQVLGDVRNRACLIVDDMASTGRTMCGAADVLRRSGASDVLGIFTHAVIAPGAEELLAAAELSHLLTSDSIPVCPKPWLDVVSIAPLLAKTIRYLAGDECGLPQGTTQFMSRTLDIEPSTL